LLSESWPYLDEIVDRTSGFQYSEWKGNFLPGRFAAAKMLPFMRSNFQPQRSTTPFTEFQPPKTIENWKQLTPDNFRFSLKAPQKITHWSKLRDCADTLGILLQGRFRFGPKDSGRFVSTSAEFQKGC